MSVFRSVNHVDDVHWSGYGEDGSWRLEVEGEGGHGERDGDGKEGDIVVALRVIRLVQPHTHTHKGGWRAELQVEKDKGFSYIGIGNGGRDGGHSEGS